MSTTTEHTPDETPTTDEAQVPLPDYAATLAELGDPQPTIDELTAELDAQTPPVIDPNPDAGTAEEFTDDRDGGAADD